MFCLNIQLLDTQVTSTFWLLWIMLLWTQVYKHLFKTLLSIPWGIYVEVELLEHMWYFYFFYFLRKLHTYLHSSCTIYSLKQSTRLPISPHSWQHFLFSVLFLGIAILMGVKWHLIILIYISLMISDIEHLFICLLVILPPFHKDACHYIGFTRIIQNNLPILKCLT